MDIRSFFGKPGATKKPTETVKSNKITNKESDSTKVKSTPEKSEKSNKNSKPEKETPRKNKTPVKTSVTPNEKSLSSQKKKPTSKRDSSKDKQTKRISRKPESDDEVAIIDDDSDFEIKAKSKKTDTNSSRRSKSKDKRDKNGNLKENLKESESSPEIKLKTKASKKGSSKRNVLISSDEEDDEKDEQVSTKTKKKSKPKRGVIFESESENEDEEPLPKKARKPRSKKRHHFSDSDDEKQMSIMEAFQHSSKPAHKEKEVSQKKDLSPKKQISAADFFGTSTVQRKEPNPSTNKRKAETSPVKNGFEEDDMEIIDDDFEETLRQLDEQERHKNKKPKLEDPAPTLSLASKLSQKAQQEEFLVAETPDKSSKSKRASPHTSPGKATPGKAMPKNSPEKKTPPKSEPVKSPVKTSPGEKTSPDKPELQKKNTGYRSYLVREGPRALGSKEIPQGAENCLEGLTFVITGILESMERDEAKSLVERYGGKVTGSLSKKTSYLVSGRDAGESKMAKAIQFGTKQLDEDGLLDLVRTLPGKKSKYQVNAEKEAAKWTPGKSTPNKIAAATPNRKTDSVSSLAGSQTPKSIPGTPKIVDSPASSPKPPSLGGSVSPTLLWVDKYKPTSLKQVIGQQGDKSNARKLLNWLKKWHTFVSSGKKPSFNRFSDDGAGFRAALLSGPPGVGKTTTAQLVCQDSEFTYVELNASDTRSKKSLQQEVSESLNNHTLSDFIDGGNKHADGKKHCLLMDEVDGMAGNEDRGGMQELITLIKNTKIPIICMCNDRNSQKIRTLANYCFDLRFQRPRLEQIKSAMMSMAFKEGVKIPPPALNEIILASNQDVRQVIHNISMWSANDKNLTYDQVKSDAAKAQKDIKLGPFDVLRKVFSGGEETAKMTLNDKSDLFFHDYSFGPLFVQENYINVHPYEARGDTKKHLQLLSRAADSIAAGDLVDRKVRGNGSWSLLPLQAIFASVIPGETMRGSLGGQIQFPSWLGKNSTTGKNDRILQELKSHMRLRVSADKKDLNMGYLPHMRHSLTHPLVEKGAEGIEEIIQQLDEYNLLKEDMDSLLEVTHWPNSKDHMGKVESKTKAAFTRAYNKEVHLTPYATGAVAKKGRKRGGEASDETMGTEEGEQLPGESQKSDIESDDEDPTADSMIKQKKSTAKGKASTAKKDTSKSKASGKGAAGKGRGKKK